MIMSVFCNESLVAAYKGQGKKNNTKSRKNNLKTKKEAIKMTTEKKNAMLSDDELDMVTGGAAATFLKKREDGKVDMFYVSGEGNIDAFKKLMAGGSVSSMNVSICTGKMSGVPADKVDAVIARRKERNPQMDVIWMN